MKKIINAIACVIFKVDKLLYNTIGIASPFRRHYWRRRANKIQKELDGEHCMRDSINRIKGSNYTTKKAIEIYDDEYGI